MPDLCGGFLIFVIVLAILATVGHVIWTIAAACFRAVFGQQKAPRRLVCPQCARDLRISRGKCLWCQCVLLLPPEFSPDASGKQFEAKLQRLLDREVIDQAEFRRISEAVRAEADSRLAPAVQATQPLPATQPAVSVFSSDLEPESPLGRPSVVSPPVSWGDTPGEATAAASVTRPNIAAHLQSIAAETQAATAAPAPGGPARSQALADLMRSFMDENNIRWGELISGLLIVGSAIGLVISLWETLKESIPYFPALLFMLVTAAIHGAGMYTLHRWNLKSTSRGLLLISLFLIPLNYLAAVALSDHRPVGDVLFLVAMGTGLVVFTTMSYFAGRKLLLTGWWLVPVGVMGASAGQVLISRLAAPGLATSTITLLFLLPLVSFLASSLGQLRMAARWPRLTVRRATQVFLVVGVAAFALVVAAGILLWKCHADGLRLTLAQLAPSLSVVAAVVLGTGGLVRARMVEKKLAMWHTAGTSIALAGGAAMLLCLVLAWPRPELLVAVGLVNFLALTGLALALDIAALHVPAILAIGLAGLIGFHLFQGHVDPGTTGTSRSLLTVLLWGQSGFALMWFSALIAAASAFWRRISRTRDASAYLFGTLGLGFSSSLIAAYAGFWSGVDGDLATSIFAVYAVVLLVAHQVVSNRVVFHPALGWTGSLLVLAALVHGLAWNSTVHEFLAGMGWLPARPVVMALLVHGTILAALGFVVPRSLRAAHSGPASAAARRAFIEVRSSSALITTTLIPFVMLFAMNDPLLDRSGYGFWAAAVWLAAALLHESVAWFVAAQLLATVALCLAVTGTCEKQAWWSEILGAGMSQTRALWSPLHLHAQMASLAVWSALWIGIRRWLGRNVVVSARGGSRLPEAGETPAPQSANWGGFDQVLKTRSWPPVERIVLGGVVAAVPILAALGCGPGAAAELQSVAPATWFGDLGWILAGTIVALATAICAAFMALVGRAPGWPGLERSEAPAGQESWRRPNQSELIGTPAETVEKTDRLDVGRAGSPPGLPFGPAPATGNHVWQTAPLAIAALFGASVLALPIWMNLATAYWNVAGGSTGDAYGAGGWLVTGIVGLALVVSLLEKHSAAAMYGCLWLLFSVPLLAAGPFETQTATASALRWGLALFGLAAALGLSGIAAWMNNGAGFGQVRNLSYGRNAALALSVLLLLALTLNTVVPEALSGMLRGPSTGSFFTRIGAEWSLAGPLLILAVTYCGVALRDGLPHLALAGSFALQLAVAVFFVGERSAGGVSIHSDMLVELVQWNGIVLGAFSLAWVALQARIDRPIADSNPARREIWSPLNVQILLTAITALIPAVWAITDIISFPGHLPDVMSALGSPLSYAALGLAMLAVGAAFKDKIERWGIEGCTVAGLAVVGLCGASGATGNGPENWVSYHILMAGWMVMTFFATLACLAPDEIRKGFVSLGGFGSPLSEEVSIEPASAAGLQQLATSASRCTTVLGGLVLFLAARGVATDPARPYWGVATAGILAFLATILALWRRSQLYAYTSARLAVLAATYAWMTPWLRLGMTPTPQSWVDLALAAAVAATLVSGFWLSIELWFLRNHAAPFDATFAYPPVHRGTSRLALILACGLSVAGLAGRWFVFDATTPIPIDVSNLGGWLLAALLACVFAGSLWDIRAKRALPSLYAVGLSAAALAIDQWGPRGGDVPYFVGQALALYVLLTSAAWVFRDRASGWAQQHGIPEPTELALRTSIWLPEATLFLAALVAAIELWVVLTFHELSWRLAGAAAVAVAALSLPAFAQNTRRSSFREAGLLFAALAAIDFGWAAMPVEDDLHFWLWRAVRLLVILAATTFAYGAVSIRILSAASEWFTPLRRAATAVGAASLASLVALLALEAYWFDPVSGAPLSGMQVAVVAAVLVGLAAALVSLAVLPGRDPLELSEAGRMLYVYAAEAVLALLFLHIYLTMPELFKGYLLPWWPFIVMGIAFFGVGVGEFFLRSGFRVLSEPLHRTGAFLPLLPALGFWIHTSNSDYSTLLFVVGLLYVVVSMWRKTFLYSLAAALAGNAGMWALWHEHGVAIFDHPQLWLIPPALSVLAAVQLNRRRLTDEQVTGLRYLCITIIYFSSTGDMFITGIAESLLMPMILAGLSVAGAFAGIALRVRAFLYLGLSFLLLSIVSMVWHAARNINHVWPWWAFGIGLGLAILTVLGVFEKKRKEVQGWLGEFRTWEA